MDYREVRSVLSEPWRGRPKFSRIKVVTVDNVDWKCWRALPDIVCAVSCSLLSEITGMCVRTFVLVLYLSSTCSLLNWSSWLNCVSDRERELRCSWYIFPFLFFTSCYLICDYFHYIKIVQWSLYGIGSRRIVWAKIIRLLMIIIIIIPYWLLFMYLLLL